MFGGKANTDEMKPAAIFNNDERLMIQQDKIRKQKKLKQPDEKQLELVRREKGFTLYVNGANAATTGLLDAGGKTTRAAGPKTSRTKTAGTVGSNFTETEYTEGRSKTAPSARSRRRQWQVASIDLKTNSGDRVKLKAPTASTTGNYAEDFEDDCSSDDSIEEETLDDDSLESANESSEIEEHLPSNDERSDVTNTVLRCNASDVKKLRQSIELRTSLRLSLTNVASSPPNRQGMSEVTTAANVMEKNGAGENLDHLLQKIMQLDLRSQRRLVKVLAELDNSPRASTAWVTSNDSAAIASASSQVESRVSPVESHQPNLVEDERNPRLKLVPNCKGGPRDSVENIRSVLVKNHSRQNKMTDGSRASQSSVSTSQTYVDIIEVCIELLSNWDHSRFIGLTGLELLDHNDKRIEIVPTTDVVSSVALADGSRNDMAVLFDGIYKTKKERHMWSCSVDSLPVIITIHAVNRHQQQNFSVSKLRIWNYNRSPSELSAGARKIRVSINGRLAYDGELSKGVANQIFDYDQIITLVAEKQPSTSSSSMTTQSSKYISTRNSGAISQSNDCEVASSLDSVQSSITGHTSNARHRRRHRLQSQLVSKLDGEVISADSDTSAGVDLINAAGTPSVVISTEQSHQENVPRKIKQNTSKVEKTEVVESPRLPSWLNVNESSDPVRPTSAGKSQSEEQNLLDNWPSVRGACHLPTLLDVADTGLSQQSAGETDCPDEAPLPRMKQIESARALRRKRQEFSLEESWTSLDLFNRCQKGRISFDIQDDILDGYIPTERSKPSVPTIPESVVVPQNSTGNVEDFTIPELPVGQNLVISIHTTWGDKHYVGLNAIEIFDSNGQPVSVVKITADPSDINILSEYTKDPRVVTNLIDGVNRTQDDTHMWLAPFTSGKLHYIFMTFEQPACISVMRIWNYNKSRIHSSRGAKDIEITLDGMKIFVGEIARACGSMIGSSEAFGDTILFTMDEDILELVAQNDQAFEIDASQDLGSLESIDERPATADGGNNESTERPVTSASWLRKSTRDGNGATTFHGRNLVLDLLSTWGDQHYIGLTGLEVIAVNDEVVPLDMSMIDADPRDLHHLSGHEDDDRTLDKLIDGENVTTSDEHMWLIPYTCDSSHQVKITFNRMTQLTALRVWNYNKSPEDTFRGVHSMHVTLDGRRLSPPEGFLIRKGPGNCLFDFAQQISFGSGSTVKTVPAAKDASSRVGDVDSDGDAVLRPRGFIYQFQLLSSWADAYYIGLNGIELYDVYGNLLVLTEANISAYPDSVNVLNDVSNDIRTPDKLIDGVNDTSDGRHMWLAPILPNIVNRLYVIFDEPIELSMIKIWNYGKTPGRGVRDIALLVDDLLVYNGTIDAVSLSSNGRAAKSSRYHTIRFTDSIEMVLREKPDIPCVDVEEQQIRLMNDRKVIATQSESKSRGVISKPADPALRPMTSMPRHDRSTTSR